MTDTNFAEGYNVLTGEVDINNPCNSKYREVHTGDAWLPARKKVLRIDQTANNACCVYCVWRQVTYRFAWNTVSHTYHIHSDPIQSIST